MRLLSTFAAAVLVAAATQASAETYSPDPSHTNVRASWTHVGFSRQQLNFRTVTGTVDLDKSDIASAKVDMTIDTSSIDTGVAALDDHLKSADFFDADEYGEAHFVSTKVEKTSDTTATVTGDLTIKDQTHPVTLEVTLNAMGEHPMGQYMDYYKGDWIGVTATGTVKRSDWGLDMMVPAISDEIQLFISTEMKAE
ncbi:polyisoprenoid-binding protein [Paroceanicella profunda]|uniref:Polyisoprenoid-binding protein n=1 Tax=Paroceanicella profunda TaxID=2579971 RepID=A0A5B8FWR5_9RHOB|nr:YceI family protein [Paroceanicella profunda]QDL91994.1 polyisoprenoid-binding protein [Paroceanicella profunda]